ncbi:alkene reductase [Actinacidiphila glaucinigra]|uniref:alkene reductase n=1 Tax=Actinacidiphila glaucinigra TaxID=235986 RepID=UPI0037189654
MTAPFEPITLGDTRVPHRIFMSPMTRNRATVEGGLATQSMVDYYVQRAGAAALIITEGTQPSRVGQGYLATPGLHSDEQVAAWRTLTDAVHAAGGTIFAQIMHSGRIGHRDLTGLVPVAPSAVRAPGVTYTAEGPKEHDVPRELTEEEILGTIADHVSAARNAVAAGFDGVELHSASGYLLHQFLSDSVNLRTDRWGGSTENRIRFVVETVRAVADAIGAQRVGLRISPGTTDQGIVENDPVELYTALLTALSDLPLAYVHTREQAGRDLTRKLRAAWPGTLVLNPQYDDERPPHEAVDDVFAEGIADAVTLGRAFLANPDLVTRIKAQGPYNTPDPASYYGGDERGYTDYPALV